MNVYGQTPSNGTHNGNDPGVAGVPGGHIHPSAETAAFSVVLFTQRHMAAGLRADLFKLCQVQ